jgi:hypothetical protein
MQGLMQLSPIAFMALGRNFENFMQHTVQSSASGSGESFMIIQR